MFRIHRIYDDSTPADKDAIVQVQEIMQIQFPEISKSDIRKLPKQLHNPLKYRFRTILFTAEGPKDQVKGFAILFHEPVLNFCYLDFISTAQQKMGRGIGSVLYEAIREEALYLNTLGLFFECLPDDPALSCNLEIRKQNAARLRFYERYGARPIINTAYETPLTPGADNPPYLVFDNLGKDITLDVDTARSIVRIILERKYKGICPPKYVEMVVDSFQDDPVKIRKPKYIKRSGYLPVAKSIPRDKRIILVINDKHLIHHVEERGYVESPVRIDSIMSELDTTQLFQKIPPRRFSEKKIKAVHDAKFVDYIKKVTSRIDPGQSIYPYIFPIRNQARPPKELSVRAGYYCIDTFTPINYNAFIAAKRAVDCALTAANEILKGRLLAYALVRPPGHHAEKRAFGGFCYLNSAAIAAEYLSKYGKIAILDIDYHHGNGQQEIFYERSDVLTISIHGHPNFAYPYFSGFENEGGRGQGKGYNINVALPENISASRYVKELIEVLKRISRYRPQFLIVALGLDTSKEDPTGTWSLEANDFQEIGRRIGTLHLPTLVVQEGGYDTRVLGINARYFFTGLWSGVYTR